MKEQNAHALNLSSLTHSCCCCAIEEGKNAKSDKALSLSYADIALLLFKDLDCNNDQEFNKVKIDIVKACVVLGK